MAEQYLLTFYFNLSEMKRSSVYVIHRNDILLVPFHLRSIIEFDHSTLNSPFEKVELLNSPFKYQFDLT